MEGLQRAVVRLLQDGDVHPQLVVLALARVTGEVGAGLALAGGQDAEELLGELAEVVRHAGREFHEMLEAGALPTAGNAQNLWRRATNGLIPDRCGTDQGSRLMSNARMPVPATALDHESTIVAVVELSARSWLVGAQVAGVPRQCRQKLAPSAAALLEHLGRLRRRAEGAGKRVVLAYEAGRDGFWLARWLIGRGIEVYVIQPSSVPVDRRARRAKTGALDVEMLLRATLAWLRGEPRVGSMVPIPGEAEEDGRRPSRERQDLIRERLAITNKCTGLRS
jgi:hypothetical protein